MAAAALGEGLQAGDELLYPRPRLVGEVARNLTGIVLIVELEAEGPLKGVKADRQAHGTLDGVRCYRGHRMPVPAGRTAMFRGDIDPQFTEEAAVDPSGNGHGTHAGHVGAQFEHHRLGVSIFGDSHRQEPGAKHPPNSRNVRLNADIPACWGHLKGLERSAAGDSRQHDAYLYRERLAHGGAFRILSLQVSLPCSTAWMRRLSAATAAARVIVVFGRGVLRYPLRAALAYHEGSRLRHSQNRRQRPCD